MRPKAGKKTPLVITIVALLLTALFVAACATYRAWSGWPATDLSWLEPGTHRETLEARLGHSPEMGSSEHGFVAAYEYDQGWIPPSEREPRKRLLMPVMPVLEIWSVGLLSVLVELSEECQRGSLVILYDASWRVLAAKECPGRYDKEECGDVGTWPRPSTLPTIFSDDKRIDLDCDLPRALHSGGITCSDGKCD